MAHARIGAPEPFTFTGAKGDTVHGVDASSRSTSIAGKKYPLAFLVHGGPQGSFGDGLSYRWNAETYAATGYAA